jgi:hypothetical protein
MSSILNATTTTGLAISPDNSGSLQLATNNGTTAVTIDTSQNVGIGTSSPAVRLDLGSGANVSGFKMTDQWQDIVTSSHVVGTRYNYGSGTYYGRLYSNATGFNLDTGTNAVNMVFGTNNTERMRIDSSGNLLVNTTSTLGTTWINLNGVTSAKNGIGIKNGTDTGTIYSLFIYNSSSSLIGSINNNGSATSFTTSSDYRLKENIAPMTGALAKVAQLKPVTYDWKAGGSSQGFIAHELQAVVPDCVTGKKDAVETYTDEDGNEQTRPKYQGIDTSFLVATLTAAIQELKAELDATKAEVQALKGVA